MDIWAIIAISVLGIAMTASILGMSWCGLMLVRNDWVYRERGKLLDADFPRYRQLPSYNCTMNKFWIWDIDKF